MHFSWAINPANFLGEESLIPAWLFSGAFMVSNTSKPTPAAQISTGAIQIS